MTVFNGIPAARWLSVVHEVCAQMALLSVFSIKQQPKHNRHHRDFKEVSGGSCVELTKLHILCWILNWEVMSFRDQQLPWKNNNTKKKKKIRNKTTGMNPIKITRVFGVIVLMRISWYCLQAGLLVQHQGTLNCSV